LLPETEKSLANELFLPLKQLKLLVEYQGSPQFDSLSRKLRRLKCVDRDTGRYLSWMHLIPSLCPSPGLYTELSNSLPPSFLEQLCDLILRNIETVIEPKADAACYDLEEMASSGEEGEAEQARSKYSFRIQMKSGEGGPLR
jgi:hypothetical protein